GCVVPGVGETVAAAGAVEFAAPAGATPRVGAAAAAQDRLLERGRYLRARLDFRPESARARDDRERVDPAEIGDDRPAGRLDRGTHRRGRGAMSEEIGRASCRE